MINRKIVFMLEKSKDKAILDIIKARYKTMDNNLPIIEYLKSLQKRTYSRYLKDYDLEKIDKDIYSLLDKIKYYNYEI